MRWRIQTNITVCLLVLFSLFSSFTCECGLWLRLLAGQEGVPGLSGEQVTSGSQVDKGEVKGQSSEGTASRV